ncbi:MAG: hypothetical protein GXY32_01260 [Ruminococcaceae bacterium]|nr:hypothetical protein [Oscillospiraceae bacterium]
MKGKKTKGYRWLFVVLVLLVAMAGGLTLLGRANQQLQAHQARLDTARQQLAELKQENAQDAGEAQAAQRKLEETERQNDALQSELDALRRQVADYADRYGALTDQSISTEAG